MGSVAQLHYCKRTDIHVIKPNQKERQCSGINTTESHIPPSKPIGKEAHTLIDNRSQTACTANQIKSSFPNRWSSINENSHNIYIYLFSILKYKTKQEAWWADVIQVNIALDPYTHGYNNTKH